MAIDMSRVRDTIATARRANYIRSIVERLRGGELSTSDIREILSMSPSGTRKYVRELLGAEVMVISRTEHIRRIAGRGSEQTLNHYKLTDDESKIEALMALLSKARDYKKKAEEPKKRVLTGDPSRHFHIMEDDTHYPVKVQRPVTPAPDPLLAQFFGFAGTQAAE